MWARLLERRLYIKRSLKRGYLSKYKHRKGKRYPSTYFTIHNNNKVKYTPVSKKNKINKLYSDQKVPSICIFLYAKTFEYESSSER